MNYIHCIGLLILFVALATGSKLDSITGRDCSQTYDSFYSKSNPVSKFKSHSRQNYIHFQFIAEHTKNVDCQKQIVHYVDALESNKDWALNMFESSANYPVGVLQGKNYELGDFDQCIGSSSMAHSIKAKYCLMDLRFSPKFDKYPEFYSTFNLNEFNLDYNPYKSFLEKIRETRDLTKKRRTLIHLGICLPKMCPAEDIEIGLNHYLKTMEALYGYNAVIKIPSYSCSTGENKGYSLGGKLVWAVIIILSKVVLLCTLWDMFRKEPQNETDKLTTVAKSFSMKNNIRKLTEQGKNDFDVFNGMKCMSMILIILGHRCIATNGSPLYNLQLLEQSYRSFPTIFLLNGIILVDTFFLIGGFLTFISLYEEYMKKKKLNTLKIGFYRWLRITPDYMLMVFFYGYVLENLGTGPIWSEKVAREAERCRQNWWTNLFYINNYVNTDKLCMFQSWYVACDLHYTLIAPAIVKIVADMGKRGWIPFFVLITMSSAFISAITYINNYDGIMRVYHSAFEDLSSSFFFSQVYTKTHHRMIPYLFGMATAYTFICLKDSKIKISKILVWICSGIAAVISIASICGGWFFYIPGRPYNRTENAIYASLQRILWSLAMGWIAIAGGLKCFGIIQPVLSNRFFMPLSRLSFGAYLVHGAVQICTTASLRTPEYMNFPKLFWMAGGDVMLSFFFALILHLFVEAPMNGIQRFIFQKDSKTAQNKESLKKSNT